MTHLSAPSPQRLRRVLYDYNLRRWRAARMVRRALVTFHRYCLPVTSKHFHPMPPALWELLLAEIRAWRHPDREVELTL